MAAFLEVSFTVTLMRLTDGGYAESGDRVFLYHFAGPDSWATLSDEALQDRVQSVAWRMYEQINTRLRAAEPSDPNFLYVKSAQPRRLPPGEAETWPWLSAQPPVWDPSGCVVVNADGTFEWVNSTELSHAVPAERDRVRLDRVLPVLLDKQLPACVEVYGQLYEQFHDDRPLDERSRYVWGAAVLFFCVLDRLATGKEIDDPMGTVDAMITWLAEDGEVARDDVESARQIYRRLFEYNVYNPNDTLFEMVYKRAWHVRYSDLDPSKPSAFQGFVHCLTQSRAILHRFEFDDPRTMAAAPRSHGYEKIAAFAQSALLPAFEEIKSTLERHGKRVFISEDDRFGDEFLEGYYREIHPSPRFARELATSPPSDDEIASGRARYLGHTLVAVDAEENANPYVGKFFVTIVYVVGPDESVSASPFVVYHMKFDNKLHAFEHRFDNAQARQPVETIDKHAVQNHFLNAYDFFKLHARGDHRPW